MKLMKRLKFYLLIMIGLLLSCGNNREIENKPDILKNSEWRGKRDLKIYLDKRVHYVVLKFSSNNSYKVGYADASGMVFQIKASGKFERDEKTDNVIYLYQGEEEKIYEARLVYDPKTDRLEGAYGVVFHRQL